MSIARANRIFAMAAALSFVSAQAFAQAQTDSRRPACTTAACKTIKKYVKAHYCGQSPFGNGPDDGCDILKPRRPQLGVVVIADYKCAWSDASQSQKCTQTGLPPSNVRNLLVDELRRLGLPSTVNDHIYFLAWKSVRSDWTLAEAYYSRTIGTQLKLCGVLGIVDSKSRLSVVRSNRLQKTDFDMSPLTQWTPLDIVDVTGDGSEAVVLQADAYENQWMEVITMRDGVPKTIFSGLGYYL